MRKIFAWLVVGLLAACQMPSGGVPAGFREGSNSKPSPVPDEEGALAFTILPQVCTATTYGDGRGESNCMNMNMQSYVGTTSDKLARVGETWLYAFEFRVGPGLTHQGHHQPEARTIVGPGINNSRVEIARWQGHDAIKNHIYDIEVDTTRGVTFLNRRCAGPQDLGKWTRFAMQITWTSDSTGSIQVSCNDRVIYARDNVETNQAPHCHVANHCMLDRRQDPTRFYFQFGTFHDSDWVGGQQIWGRIPESGLTTRFRNIDVRRL